MEFFYNNFLHIERHLPYSINVWLALKHTFYLRPANKVQGGPKQVFLFFEIGFWKDIHFYKHLTCFVHIVPICQARLQSHFRRVAVLLRSRKENGSVTKSTVSPILLTGLHVHP